MASVRLEWDLLPPEDDVARYDIGRRTIEVDAAVLGRIRRAWHNATGAKSLMGGWRQVAEIPATQNYFEDDGRMLVKRFLRPTYYHNTEIIPYVHYEYRIRAVSHNNQKGVWRHCRVRPLSAPPIINYLLQGRVIDVYGTPANNISLSVSNIHTPRFGVQRTDSNGEYQFNLGTTPPVPPLNDLIFCNGGATHYRIAANIPLPSPPHPIIICDFELIPRAPHITPRALRAILPPGYITW